MNRRQLQRKFPPVPPLTTRDGTRMLMMVVGYVPEGKSGEVIAAASWEVLLLAHDGRLNVWNYAWLRNMYLLEEW